MELLGWMITGLVIGILSRFALARRPSTGPVLLILLGIAGAMLAGFLGRALDLFQSLEPLSFVAAAGGAAAVVLLYRFVLGPQRRR